MKEKYEAAYARMAKRLIETPGPLATPCMIWPGAKDQNGHGNVYLFHKGKGKTRKSVTDKTHRVAFLAGGGVLAPGQVVRHRCDVRDCCAQDHLEAGTQLMNVRDMIERGRARNQYGPYGQERSTALADALAFT